MQDSQDIFKDKLKFTFDHLDARIRPLFKIEGDSASKLTFSHGSSIRVGTSLRGSTLQILHISEFGKICAKFPEKAREVMSGALNTIKPGQSVWIESTAEGKEGRYFDMVQTAKQKVGTSLGLMDFKYRFFPWWKENAYVLDDEIVIKPELEKYFDSLELKGISLTPPQKKFYAKKYESQLEDMKREYPSTDDEAFEASQIGNWYSEQMRELYASNRVTHLLYDKSLPVHTAWDIGQSDHTSIWFFQLPPTGIIHVIDYWQRTDTPLDQIASMLSQKGYTYGTHLWPHDAKNRHTSGITYIQQAANFNLYGLVLDSHSVLDGINQVRSTLSKMIFNGPKCREGLLCLENYVKRWNPNLGGFTSEPVHNQYSHGCFVGETLIHMKDCEKQILNIEVGDYVKTPNGYKKVLNKFTYEVDSLQLIETQNRRVKCTKNHKIFMRKGLISADSISYNDEIFTLEDFELCQKIGCLGQEKNLGFRDYFLSMKMKKLYILTDTDINGMDITIEKQNKTNLHFQHFKELYGLIIMEKFLKNITSTIKMAIQKIMTLKTLNLFHAQTIPNYTVIQKSTNQGQEYQYIKPWNTQKNGILQKKEKNGIQNMQKKLILEKKNLLKKYVNSVIKNMMQKLITKDFVQINAKQDIDTSQESIINKENAKYVTKSLHVTNMSLKERVVRNVTINLPITQKVYDIEVEDDHCYYANGFLVSNSDAMRYLCAGYQKIQGSGTCDDDIKAINSYFQLR